MNPITCPECGAADVAVMEHVLQRVRISAINEDGSPEYQGDASNVFWDTAEPVEDTEGHLSLECLSCDYEWWQGANGAEPAVQREAREKRHREGVR